MVQITQLVDGGNHFIYISGPELVFQLKDALFFILFADADIFCQRGDAQIIAAPLPVNVGEPELAQSLKAGVFDNEAVHAHTGGIVVVKDHKLTVSSAVHVGLNAVIALPVACRHKGRAGIFLFQTAQAPVSNGLGLLFVKFDCIHQVNSLSP